MTDHELNAVIIGHIFNLLVFVLNSMGWIKTGSRFYILGTTAILGSYGCAWLVEGHMLASFNKHYEMGRLFFNLTCLSVPSLALLALFFWFTGALYQTRRINRS